MATKLLIGGSKIIPGDTADIFLHTPAVYVKVSVGTDGELFMMDGVGVSSNNCLEQQDFMIECSHPNVSSPITFGFRDNSEVLVFNDITCSLGKYLINTNPTNPERPFCKGTRSFTDDIRTMLIGIVHAMIYVEDKGFSWIPGLDNVCVGGSAKGHFSIKLLNLQRSSLAPRNHWVALGDMIKRIKDHYIPKNLQGLIQNNHLICDLYNGLRQRRLSRLGVLQHPSLWSSLRRSEFLGKCKILYEQNVILERERRILGIGMMGDWRRSGGLKPLNNTCTFYQMDKDAFKKSRRYGWSLGDFFRFVRDLCTHKFRYLRSLLVDGYECGEALILYYFPGIIKELLGLRNPQVAILHQLKTR